MSSCIVRYFKDERFRREVETENESEENNKKEENTSADGGGYVIELDAGGEYAYFHSNHYDAVVEHKVDGNGTEKYIIKRGSRVSKNWENIVGKKLNAEIRKYQSIDSKGRIVKDIEAESPSAVANVITGNYTNGAKKFEENRVSREEKQIVIG